jgi:hypothetical protein
MLPKVQNRLLTRAALKHPRLSSNLQSRDREGAVRKSLFSTPLWARFPRSQPC